MQDRIQKSYTYYLDELFKNEKKNLNRNNRECVSAGAQIRRSLGHHLLHQQILKILVVYAVMQLVGGQGNLGFQSTLFKPGCADYPDLQI